LSCRKRGCEAHASYLVDFLPTYRRVKRGVTAVRERPPLFTDDVRVHSRRVGDVVHKSLQRWMCVEATRIIGTKSGDPQTPRHAGSMDIKFSTD
jgi:hypothetical protein